MSGIRDTATVTLNVNGAQAKQMMSDLEKKIRDTETAISDMKKKMADPKDIEKAKKDLKNYKKQLDEMKAATDGVNRALENLELATPRELEKALKTLNRQLKDMVPGSDVWHSHVEKIRELKSRLSELKSEMSEQKSLWGEFKDWASDVWPSIDLLASGYDNMLSTLRDYVDEYADMEQEMANVRKFTGMTEEQVAALNERFKELDTRSYRVQLNRLAQEAGSLGKTSEEDVLGFVRAADKINVALDDLGNGATLTLSKLTGIFGDEAKYGTEQSLLKVGSVINELSQNCSASAPYLANFAERLGGVGSQAKMSIPQIMGFAAVLDENSQKVEASATALSQVIVRLYQDPAKYAKAAGLDVKEFADLMQKDANSALILFLETLNKAGGMDVLSPMFKDMGENGSRAISALATLATNIEKVKEQQRAANVAFDEGTSIDAEFAVQNDTVEAALDKCKNKANELRVELGMHLYPLMSHFLTTGSAIMRILLNTVRFISANKVAIVALAAAWAVYLTALNASSIALKLHYGYLVVAEKAKLALRAAVLLLSSAYNLVTGNITRASAAMKLFNLTVKANPIGLLLSLITAAVAAFMAFKSKVDEAKKSQMEVNKALHETNSQLRTEQVEIDKAFNALKKAKKGTKEYEEAKNNIINQYGQYLSGLIDEKNRLIDVEAAYLRVSAAARNAAIARGMGAAKKAVDDKFIEDDSDLMGKVEEKLKKYLKNQEDLAPIMQLIRADLDKNHYISNETGNIIKGAINKGKKENSAAAIFDAIRIVGENYDKYDQDIKDVETKFGYSINEFEGYAKSTLDIMYDDLNNQILDKNNKTYELIANGMVVATYKSKAEAAAALAKLDSARAMMPAEGTVGTGNAQTFAPEPLKSSKSVAVRDKFDAEKDARERAEAEAKLSYYRGLSSYSEYTSAMEQISIDYYQSLLNRDDLSSKERLQIQAQYWEAVNKQTLSANKRMVDSENETYQEILYNLNEAYKTRLSEGVLSAEERMRLEKSHKESLEIAELKHLSALIEMYEEGSAERLDAQQRYQEAELAALRRHQQEYETEEAKFAKIKEDYFGDNAAEKQKNYDKAFEALKIVYNKELLAVGDNAAEKLRIEEAFLKAQIKLREKYGLISKEEAQKLLGEETNGLVDWLNDEGGKALIGSMSALTSGMSSIFSGLSTMMQAELDIQTAQIEKRYSKEISLAQGNSYKVAQLEKKKEAEIAKVKNEANKKMYAMQVIQAIAQTAQNALSAYGSAAAIPVVGYILAPVAAAMAVAAGAIQIAAIKKQQQAAESKGYSSGGFTRPGRVDEPAGIVHAGEWVASQKLLANPVARPMIEALDYAQRTNTIGSLSADDVSRSITAPDSLVRISEDNDGVFAMVAAAYKMAGAVTDLTDRLKEPIVAHTTVAGDYGINKAQEEYAKLIRNVTPKSKRK